MTWESHPARLKYSIVRAKHSTPASPGTPCPSDLKHLYSIIVHFVENLSFLRAPSWSFVPLGGFLFFGPSWITLNCFRQARLPWLLGFLAVVGSPFVQASTFDREVKPFLTRHCLQCHNANLRTAEINLGDFDPEHPVRNQQDLWQAVLRELRAGRMPPPGNPRPTVEQLRRVDQWIEARLEEEAASISPIPGRVTARRLNRSEYDNTIRDWLGLDLSLSEDFPIDDTGYGFDNIGDVLSLSPLLMEKYLAAAEEIAGRAVVVRRKTRPMLARYLASRSQAPPSVPEGIHTVRYSPEGRLRAQHPFPSSGEYELRVRVVDRRRIPPAEEGQWVPAELPSATLSVLLDGSTLQTFHVETDAYHRGTFDIRIRVDSGAHLLEALPRLDSESLGTTFNQAVLEDSVENPPDRLVYADSMEILGPFKVKPKPLTDSHRRVLICEHDPGKHLAGCTDSILRNLTLRAYRRLATEQEIKRLRDLVASAQSDGEPLERGIQLALQAVLASPHFLFRLEFDPEADPAGSAHPLGPYELASRLSYFLWSSLPDDELFGLAQRAELNDPQVLRQQVGRMLKDPRSKALVENFAGQWLQLRNLESAQPDPDRFPDFDEPLREAMRRETELFFRWILEEDRSLIDFLDASYTFLNQRLARHYGHPGVEGSGFRRIELAGDQRGGLMTHASMLTVSSYPTRTSPVLRGKWILETLLGAPPPPPPVMETLEEEPESASMTLRQRLEKHRSLPACAACHRKMDALGFGLENYDAIGAWRKKDGGVPVDAAGELPGGRSFQGPKDLKALLAETERAAFVRCLTEKMLTYALGRGLESYDKTAVDRICRELENNGFRFGQLVQSIVESLPFQMRTTNGGGS